MRHKWIGALFLIGALSFSFWPDSASAAWQTFTSPAGDFSVSMPGKPQLATSVHHSFVGAVKDNTYTIKSGGMTYSASYSELPGIAVSLGGSHTIFNKAKKGLLKETGGTEIAFTETNLGSSEGRELSFALTGGGSGKARFFLIDKRLYVIVASGPSGSAAAVSQFLNSFKLLS